MKNKWPRLGRSVTVFLIGFLTALQAAWASRVQELVLQVGQQKSVKGDENLPLSLSRRGIADFENVGGGRWLITGLKPGFVVGKQVQDGQSRHRWDVRIQATTPNAGIRDDPHPNPWSAEQRQELLRRLSRLLGSEFQIVLAESGTVQVTTFCAKDGEKRLREWVASRLSGVVPAARLVVWCNLTAPRRLELEGAAFVISEGSDSTRDGVATEILAGHAGSLSDLLTKVSAVAQQREFYWEVVARPHLWLLPHQAAEAATGSELAITVPGYGYDEGRVEWKSVGANFEATLRMLDDDSAHVDYRLDLKSPGPGGGVKALSSHRLAGTAKLSLGRVSAVARMNLSSSTESRSGSAVFSGWPIIGPLFSIFDRRLATSQLWLVLHGQLAEALQER